MSSAAATLSASRREQLVRYAQLLAWSSLVWMTAEGVIAVVAGINAGSIALIGFGIDSAIEGMASVVIIWRFWGKRALSETAERRAQKLVAVQFFILAPYAAIESVRALVTGRPARGPVHRLRRGARGPRGVEGGRMRLPLIGATGLAIVVLAAALGCAGGGDDATSGSDVGPLHVHGLGVNPADGALFIATHTGLFRSGEGESTSVRVGESYQDTMGFAVAGEDRFLGSGHPDLRHDLPPLLGLIESTDAGRSWQSISLSGDADFHVLRSAGRQVYGYDASNDRLLASPDAGRTWSEVERPVPLVDLVVDPTDSKHLLAAGVSDFEEGLYESRDSGLSWERIGEAVGLLAWPDPQRLFLVDGAGRVFTSNDSGSGFRQRGEIGGRPAAILGQSVDELFAALHNGTIKRSTDGGATWTVRSTP